MHRVSDMEFPIRMFFVVRDSTCLDTTRMSIHLASDQFAKQLDG